MLKTGHRTRYHLRAFEFLASRRRSRAVLTCTLLASFLATMPTAGLQAGDILRGGASAGNAKRNSDARANAGAAAAEAAKVRAQDRLARTTKAVNDMRALQASARAAAGANAIPNGLTQGGLKVLTGANAKWEGANSAAQSGNTIGITQTAAQAILHWETFNVGSQTTVNFDQSAGGADSGKWIAFNKVFDPTAKPSEIRGKINAQGQVYIINQNGIIFGSGSQVNARTLVASSLPINDTLIQKGLLNNPSVDWLFDGSTLATNAEVTVEPGAILSSPASSDKSGGRVALIGLNVKNAGTISVPNGQAILAAGTQVGMAAHDANDPSFRGLDTFVGSVGTGGTATNSGLIEAKQGSALMIGKKINQLGVIDSSTSVSLNGRIDLVGIYGATRNPSYQTEGTAPFVFTQSGEVLFGDSSVTRILPEWESSEKIPSTRLSLSSMIKVQGSKISLLPNSMILATSASKLPDPSRVALGIEGKPISAGIALEAGIWDSNAKNSFLPAAGSIDIKSGAFIDASGSTNVKSLLSDLILNLKLRRPEFANSPLQRNGILRDVDLNVDSRITGTYGGLNWYGTPLGDVSGYVGLIKRSVGELTANGGTINLSAGNNISAETGSSIDVSGGWISVKGSKVSTSKVMRNGALLDISDAVPDVTYDGIFSGQTSSTHSKWGVTKTFNLALTPSNSRYEPDYIEGANAGQFTVSSPNVSLEGELLGQTVVGPRQMRTSSFSSGTLKFSSKIPNGAAISLNFKSKSSVTDLTGYYDIAPLSPPDIVLASDGSSKSAGATFGPIFTSGGFNALQIENSEGSLSIDKDQNLVLPSGGILQASAKNIMIEGTVAAPGGQINLTAYNYSPYQADIQKKLLEGTSPLFVKPVSSPLSGRISIGPRAVLSTAGLVVDDRLESPASQVSPITTDGGTISLTAYSINLDKGGLLDVSGGAYLPAFEISKKSGNVEVKTRSRAQYGRAGSLMLIAGKDPKISLLGGQLNLGATLKAYSGTTSGGSLTFQTGSIFITNGSASSTGVTLSPDFFCQGGFSNFTLRGIGVLDTIEQNPTIVSTTEVAIASETIIRPLVLQSAVSLGYGSQPVMKTVLRPEGLRSSTTLSLQAPGMVDSFNGIILSRGDISIGTGSDLTLDAFSQVSLSAQTLHVNGAISAPGGKITIQGAKSKDINPIANEPLVTVLLGANAKLSTSGKTILSYDPSRQMVGEYLFGGVTKRVIPGGSIQVAGNIYAAAGASLDVSGTSSTLTLPWGLIKSSLAKAPSSSGLTSPIYALDGVPTSVETNAGSISLSGSEVMVSNAKLIGKPGGPTALGGALSISGGVFYLNPNDKLDVDVSLSISQGETGEARLLNTPAIGGALVQVGGSAMKATTGTILSAGVARQSVVANPVFFAVDQFQQGGFSSLSLGGNVRFSGDVLINAGLMAKVATGGVIYADSTVQISAPYVALGKPFQSPIVTGPNGQRYYSFSEGTNKLPLDPNYGPGRLIIHSNLLDIGDLSLQGIGSANLRAEGGDIRGSGTLNIAGSLTLAAREIYPVTANTFTVVSYDHNSAKGSIRIESTGGTPNVPYSAGGSLRLFASDITQAGVLIAPFGNIVLGWDGTGTKPVDPMAANPAQFPVTETLRLDSKSITSVSAVDSLNGQSTIIPYGVISKDGNSWIAPNGVDISTQGPPEKQISLSAKNITTLTGSTLNLQGGGDLYAYQWMEGQGGGTQDVLDSSKVGSFAILPGYQNTYAPYAAFNDLTASFIESESKDPILANLGTDRGYFNAGIAPGDQIYLEGYNNLKSGIYTLLPARYALLPGAMLVTPQSKVSLMSSYQTPEGAFITKGSKLSGIADAKTIPNYQQRFEVAEANVVRARADYADNLGSSFFSTAAAAKGAKKPLLPGDAGYLLVSTSTSLTLLGNIQGRSISGGRGAFIDFNSSKPFSISENSGALPGSIWISPTQISKSGVESLLIGGSRSIGSDYTSVAVNTAKILVDTKTIPLVAPEVILASTGEITVAQDSTIQSTGTLANAGENLQITGSGSLLRVSADAQAKILRTGAPFTSTAPNLQISAGVVLNGAGITLDSTYASSLNPTASLISSGIALSSGQISIRFENPGPLQPTIGLVLEGNTLATFEAAKFRSLLSYSSIDLYGSGQLGSRTVGDLTLSAGEIRRRDSNTSGITIGAKNLTLGNSAGSGAASISLGSKSGQLSFEGDTINIATNKLQINGYSKVVFDARSGLQTQASDGLATEAFGTQGDLTVRALGITGLRGSQQRLSVGGDFRLSENIAPTSSRPADIAASLSLTARSIVGDSNTSILLPSGILALSATNGAITLGGDISVEGRKYTFAPNVNRFTNAGQITLSSSTGDVTLSPTSHLSMAADAGGGDAGSLSVYAPMGNFMLPGSQILDGRRGLGGKGGSFALDVQSLPLLSGISDNLALGFSESMSFRVRTGNVLLPSAANPISTKNFLLSADSGDITIANQINASGKNGGKIVLAANGSVIIQSDALLNVKGEVFDNAGKGGEIHLEAGSQKNGAMGTGRVSINTGSRLLLGVSEIEDAAGNIVPSLLASAESLGKFTGTLHIRAPQNLSNAELIRVDPLAGSIKNASNILIEGYQLFNLNNTDGTLTSSGAKVTSPVGPVAVGTDIQGSINQNGATFLTTPNYNSIRSRLLTGSTIADDKRFVLAPGAEVIKENGDLTLGTTTSSSSLDWNLGTYRFGPQSAPGILTLRSSGNLVFFNTLSDGFEALASTNAANGFSKLWLAPLMTMRSTLPDNLQSWSYVLSAGADLSAANRKDLQNSAALVANKGSLLLGKELSIEGTAELKTTTSSLIGTAGLSRYQVIRTGTGDISINAARNVTLRNQFASIYTAGVQVPDASFGGTFTSPTISYPTQQSVSQAAGRELGIKQQGYGVYYGIAGGGISIIAQNDIERSSATAQMPSNWLYRRGYVDSTGTFGTTSVKVGAATTTDLASSTTWWVDFSNFFEGVGALSGGHVSLFAGNNISNIDAVAPTNARMSVSGPSAIPTAANLVELGGGDLSIRAGKNIDGGTFYVEKGAGSFTAGGQITTNSQRSLNPGAVAESVINWMPTTFFVGKANLNISALGDVRIGPVANPFLLPAGVGNPYWLASYFSTYSPESSVAVSSIAGDVTLATKTYSETNSSALPWLWAWYDKYLADSTSKQPWLRLNLKKDVFSTEEFKTLSALMPSSLLATSILGSINLAGDITTNPSPVGNLEFLTAGSINGMQPIGTKFGDKLWVSSTINLSDADPSFIPSITSPVATYKSAVDGGSTIPVPINTLFFNTSPNLSSALKALTESGATENISSQQGVHKPGLLHKNDANPVRLYAATGSIQGITLFSSKFARIFAGRDIRDISFYLQNTNGANTSVVSAARDLLLFDENSPLWNLAKQSGNTYTQTALNGDLQIGGPGNLEVIAGRNLNIGSGLKTNYLWTIYSEDGTKQTSPINATSKQSALQIAALQKSYTWLSDSSQVVLLSKLDGTGQGITSVGSLRNPYLPPEGANLVLAAGVGSVDSILDGTLKWASLEKSPSGSGGTQTYAALQTFFETLRDAGRAYSLDQNASAYATGFEAISSVFGKTTGSGDLLTGSRDIRTKSGGDISIFVPGGKLDLGLNSGNNPNAPSGIVTAMGGKVSIFADQNVNIGKGRIFTLRGGDMVIWSSTGDIAAGREKTTVQTAPPTGVLYDTGSADVRSNLGGLATGGGIGVLASVEGVEPGDVDLIAPAGVVDAGDAGIRVTGNLNIAATAVLNAGNIAAGGSSSGVPSAPTAAAPNVGGLTAGSASSAAANNAASQVSQQARPQEKPVDETLSLISVEILGYGGGDSDGDGEG